MNCEQDRESHLPSRHQIGTTMIEVATRNSPERRVLPAVSATTGAAAVRVAKQKQRPKVPPKPKMAKAQESEQVRMFYRVRPY